MSSPQSDSDEFYESIDRILSSSCSSTSASDDEDTHRRPHIRFPPASAASIDVWLTAPAPVEERRRLLLHQMGLATDPALSRLLDPAAPRRRRQVIEFPRSASFDGVYSHTDPSDSAAIARSRSDGAVDAKQPPPAKPPLVGRSLPPSRGNIDLDLDDEVRRCTIKSLDTGREFIVKEIHDNGMCEHLREVGTGRQLTIEEFEMCVGRSPIVQELMRRQTVQDSNSGVSSRGPSPSAKKNGGWLRSIKNAVGGARERRSSDERDTSSEKGGRRSSSATDDSQDGADCPHRTKVRHYGKSQKELTCLYLSQEIQAHNGAIWSIKFSLDGRYLASAGEDCVIHVWQVVEQDRKGELLAERAGEENGSRGSRSQELTLAFVEGNHLEKRRSKLSGGRKSMSSDQLMVPEHVFGLSEKPVCTFRGHCDDVLDLSWSKSQYLLSSSMDKTVRLWHMSNKSCLKTFSHSDYVTCIQFNPVDDRFFISGSLDEKVRIWSIPDRQVVDWNDLHEMVTAACYTPDGQGALVGSHKGRCHLYHTSDNKLHQKSQIDLQNKKRKSSSKKITGFQFAPGSSSELLITSADSRIRVVDGAMLVQKFKGFRNTSSQIAASLTANGKYVISASEDSHVYIWRHDVDSRPGRSKGAVTNTQSYEYFHCQNVTVALPWPGTSTSTSTSTLEVHSTRQNWLDEVSNSNPSAKSIGNGHNLNLDCQEQGDIGHYSDRVSATWPEEKLTANNYSTQSTGDLSVGGTPRQSRSAWGMVIVTAGRGGEIRTFQNFGIPVRA